jgi:hypothetical protein
VEWTIWAGFAAGLLISTVTAPVLNQGDFRNALDYFQEGNGPSTPAEKNANKYPAGL